MKFIGEFPKLLPLPLVVLSVKHLVRYERPPELSNAVGDPRKAWRASFWCGWEGGCLSPV